jgi:hypothetical protein
LQGTATYTGTTFGTIALLQQQGCEPIWNSYAASGQVHMEWDFRQHGGTLEISNFTGVQTGTGMTSSVSQLPELNISGTMRMPGQLNEINKFSGSMSGTVGYSEGDNVWGKAVGSFAANGSDKTAGVIGNWIAGNETYRATGIYGAGRDGPVNPNGNLPPLPQNEH